MIFSNHRVIVLLFYLCVILSSILIYYFREFLFPNDLHIDLEYWSETGEYTQDELHEVKSVHYYILPQW